MITRLRNFRHPAAAAFHENHRSRPSESRTQLVEDLHRDRHEAPTLPRLGLRAIRPGMSGSVEVEQWQMPWLMPGRKVVPYPASR